MTDSFVSPMFGETRNPTDDERNAIAVSVEETPVAVFQELNKSLNKKGLCILFDTLPESQNSIQ